MSDDAQTRLADPDRRVRLAAVAERGDDEAAELLDLGLDDHNRLVRFRALEELTRICSPRARALLLARVGDEHEPTLLRRFAVDAVTKIGTPEAADALEARLGNFTSRWGRRILEKNIARRREGPGAAARTSGRQTV